MRGTLVVPLADSAVEWTIPAEILRSDVGLRWQKLHKGIREAIASHLRSRRGAELALREPRRRGARIGSTKVSGENPGLKHASRVPGA